MTRALNNAIAIVLLFRTVYPIRTIYAGDFGRSIQSPT